MQYKLVVLLAFISISIQSQVVLSDFEKYPVFSTCSEVIISDIPNCFNTTLIDFVIKNLKVPAIVDKEKYEGKMVLLFEVTKEGKFKLLYTDAIYEELKTEAQNTFNRLPQITPGTYNGSPTYMQFSLPILLPLSRNNIESTNTITNNNTKKNTTQIASEKNPMQQEYDRIKNEKFNIKNKYESGLNIPFSHQVYSRFEREWSA